MCTMHPRLPAKLRTVLRLSAAIGVQMAQPDRPVVCVVGEGSVQYAVTAFWSAVAYDVPVTFLVLRNSEYAILKWFSAIEGVEGAPGLDLPALDTASIASGYGVNSVSVSAADELAIDIELRDGRPVAVILDALADLVVGEYVDGRVIVEQRIEPVHRRGREAALRPAAGAFHEEHDAVRGEQLVDTVTRGGGEGHGTGPAAGRA